MIDLHFSFHLIFVKFYVKILIHETEVEKKNLSYNKQNLDLVSEKSSKLRLVVVCDT